MILKRVHTQRLQENISEQQPFEERFMLLEAALDEVGDLLLPKWMTSNETNGHHY